MKVTDSAGLFFSLLEEGKEIKSDLGEINVDNVTILDGHV